MLTSLQTQFQSFTSPISMSQAFFPLMDLPQELQDMVYHAHFTLPNTVIPAIVPTSCETFFKKRFPVIGLYKEEYQDRDLLRLVHPKFPPSTLDFLLVCRKIYEQCRYMFYAWNVFFFPGMDLLFSFLREVDLLRIQHLRSIEVDYWSQRDAGNALRILSEAERLEKLVLHVGRDVLTRTPYEEHLSHTGSPDLVLDTILARGGPPFDNVVHEKDWYKTLKAWLNENRSGRTASDSVSVTLPGSKEQSTLRIELKMAKQT